jgi:hypothetical protein
MTAPVDSDPQLERVRADSRPVPNHSIPGLPSDRSLERIQKYLAPLQRLGNQRSAWIGAALLLIGVFLPAKAATIPFLNVTVSVSFWDFSKFESLLLILLAFASGWLALIHDYKWLWITGGVSLLFMAIEFIDALTSSYIHPSWGWLVLFPGVALLLAAAALKRDPRETSGNAVSVVRDLAQRAAAGR